VMADVLACHDKPQTASWLEAVVELCPQHNQVDQWLQWLLTFRAAVYPRSPGGARQMPPKNTTAAQRGGGRVGVWAAGWVQPREGPIGEGVVAPRRAPTGDVSPGAGHGWRTRHAREGVGLAWWGSAVRGRGGSSARWPLARRRHSS